MGHDPSALDHTRPAGAAAPAGRFRWPFRLVLSLVPLLLLALQPGESWAQRPQPPEIVAVRVGFNNLYKVGQWTPVTVTLRGGSQQLSGEIELIVPDGDGVPSRIISPRRYLVTPGQTTTAQVQAKFGRIESDVTVRFVDLAEDEVFADRHLDSRQLADEEHLPWAMFSGQQLFVSLGPSIGVESALRLHPRDEREAIQHAQLASVDQLPTRWYGYEGVDALILSTSQPETYRRLLSNSEQLAAIEQWVEMGGRLVLVVGSQAPELLAPGQPLARFAPGRFVEMTTLSQASELEAYSDAQEPLRPARGALRLSVPRLTDIEGKIEAPDSAATDLPLVVRTPRGFGEVVFVAVDLDRQPFVDWKGRGEFVNKLLRLAPEPEQAGNENAQYTSLALTDLAGQLRGALDQFEGVKLVPFSLVALLVFGYILLIGPGDYFLVKKVLRRMELTWVTFPLIVVLVSFGAYQLAYWLKGDQLRLNQVDLVDVDLESGLVRGTSWSNIFSPRTDAYDLALRPRRPDGQPLADEQSEELLSWLGLPGSALGGMDPSTSNPPLFTRPYTFSPDLDRLIRMPIQVWSTKSLAGRWSTRDTATLDVDGGPGQRRDSLTLADDRLEGTITNTLETPLEQCWLAYDRWVYPLGRLEPGQQIDLAELWQQRQVLASALKGSRMDYDEQKKQHQIVAETYDPGSFNVRHNLRMMMFYEVAGGREYVRLLNRYQPFVDLSSHLALDRAILVGFTDRPGADLVRSHDRGQSWEPVHGPLDKRWTCYRFVIPVRPAVETPAG